MLQRPRWMLYRLVFVGLHVGMILTGGLLLYLLAPLTTTLMLGDGRFWRHLHLFPRMARTAYRQCWLLLSDPEYRAIFAVPLREPPASGPDPAMACLSAIWQSSPRECAGCSCCCRKLGCALLEEGSGNCLAYDTFYWRYFNCGRYPTSQAQIDYFACPKWRLREQPNAVAWGRAAAAST